MSAGAANPQQQYEHDTVPGRRFDGQPANPANPAYPYGAATPATPGTAVATDATALRDRVGWGPIWAGLITTLPVFLILELLAYGIGLGQTSAGVNAWVTGILVLIAFFIGGWVAGRTSGVRGSGAGLVTGFLVWGLGVTLILALTLAGAGQLFGAVGRIVAVGNVGGAGISSSDLAGAARTAAWGGFLSLIVSAAAAMLGCWLGALGRPLGRLYRGR